MLRAETLAIHAGRAARIEGEPLNPPLVPASNFYDAGYAREQGSPGWAPLEAAIGALEGGTAIAFGSGMAAISAVLETLPSGAKVVGPSAGYAWTRSLLARHAQAGRIELVGVDTTDTAATLAACDGAALLYVETPSNPLVRIAELDALCAGAHERGAQVAVDGTFASPLLQRTLAQGADFAIQSATKFIGGHSDLMLGVVTSTAHAGALHHVRAQLGALPGALEAYLALRGLRTLPVRLEIAQRNAQVLARRLAQTHVVYYPGLPGDAGHERATRLMDGYGAMLAFEHADADEVCRRVRVITHAKSLGGVESLIERRAPGLLRLSVGCEHVEDLWDDLERAL
ncbi:PLP-dependent aspartate aminotransferase family protein [Solirubrobacter taibaiensis]|nr:PLP-dependent aspartate aminotransferase family protein [Solirubrobacter taibaiensis]